MPPVVLPGGVVSPAFAVRRKLEKITRRRGNDVMTSRRALNNNNPPGGQLKINKFLAIFVNSRRLGRCRSIKLFAERARSLIDR